MKVSKSQSANQPRTQQVKKAKTMFAASFRVLLLAIFVALVHMPLFIFFVAFISRQLSGFFSFFFDVSRDHPPLASFLSPKSQKV